MRAFISRQPALFVLASSFLAAWVIWGVSPLFEEVNEGFKRQLDLLGLLAPSLAALFVTTSLKGLSFIPNLRTHLIAFVFAFTLMLAAMVSVFDMTFSPLSIFGALMLSDLAAYVVSLSLTHKKSGHLFRSVADYKIPPVWLLVGLLIFPFILLGSALATGMTLADIGGFFEPYATLGERLSVVVVTLFALATFGGALGQELCWRGFLMPRMVRRFHPFIVSLLIGALWALWYAPLYFNGFYEGGLEGVLIRFLWNVPLAIVFTWVFIRGRGSVLLAILMHASLSIGLFVLPLSENALEYAVFALIAIALFISLVDPLLRRKNDAFEHLRDRSDLYY